MKIKILTSICILFFALIACEKQDPSINKDPINLTLTQKQIVDSTNTFGLNIFKEVVSNSGENENVFISPLSISMALSMLYNGAANATREELKDGLGYSGMTDEQINIANRDLIKALIEVDPKVIMEIANSIWYRNTFQPEQEFLATNKDYYDADARSVTFDPTTVDLINNWVSTKTHNKITTIIDQIPDDAIMYLINAIYFKGTWKYKFDKDKTLKMPFNLGNGGSKQTDFMFQDGSFEYMKNDLLTAVNLPYGGENYSMVVLVPNGENTYQDILAALNQQNWEIWNNSFAKRDEVKVYFPKFKLSFKKELNDDLAALGMPTMFSDFADLTGIHHNGGLKVSKVMHKTFVEVNEEGTEAAAVTSVEIIETAYNPANDLIVKADKPFIYIIKEKDTNTLLFMGVLNDPVTEN